MTDQPRPDNGTPPSAPQEAVPAEQTVDQLPASAELDAGLQAAFADSGPLLPAEGSVLKALSACLPSVPRIHLREPVDEHPTPVNRPSSEQMPQPQDLPDRYQLVGEIARGGMGAVFKGRDLDLGRDVAVKVMLEGHKGRTELLQRFVEEAQIGGQLQHPGIVPVYELGQAGDKRPYFTMKLVKGQTLSAILKARTDPHQDWPRLLGIFEDVCQTLAYAHARGVIHRDLKPSNIMVGSFGEVQVMDWGLAKVLPKGGIADEQPAAAEEATVIRTVRSDGSGTPGAAPEVPVGSRTHAGTVMGTPAYMAPEQARGETDTLDERCDAFGLGALLCQILTGKPPYTGKHGSEIHDKAVQADLTDAWQRLDSCDADVALIALAKQCLTPDKTKRLRHAGEVAAQVTAYQQSVQARLQQAEIDKAAAEARAEAEQKRRHAEQARADEERKRREVEQGKAQEERKRRRVTVALAASLLLLVGGASAAGLWYQRDQAQRETEELGREAEQLAREKYLRREVTTALAEAQQLRQQLHQQLGDPLQVHELLSDIDGWGQRVKNARLAWERAQALADSGPDLLGADLTGRLQQLQEQLQADEQDFRLALALDTIRLEASTLVGGKWAPWKVVPKYASVFAKAGYDIKQEDGEQLAAHIGRSPIRSALVAALDHWAMATPNQQLRPKLLMLARRADPDPWRDQVRDALRGNDVPNLLWKALMGTNVQKLQRLAEQVDVSRQSPQILEALALQLPKGNGQGAALLRRALVHYPRDFWLHVDLGNRASDPVERAGCYQAALAVRSQSSAAHNNWGLALYDKKDYDSAISHFQQALKIDPNNVLAHSNWGNALRDKKDYDGAISHYQQALKIDPNYAPAHTNWGIVLYAKQDYAGAISHCQQALQLDPNDAHAHTNWGIVLYAKQDYAGAIRHYQQALKLDPNFALVHNNWGVALADKKDYAGAISHYQQALKIDPNDAQAHHNWGIVLAAQQDYDGAIRHFQQALKIDPNNVLAHSNWGNALRDKKDYAGAISHYQQALQFDPNDAHAHASWGTALAAQQDYAGAISHYQQALKFDPKDAKAHYNWGRALYDKKDYAGAISHYQQALQLDPNYAEAHCNLGSALRNQGHFAEALNSLQKGHQLGSQRIGWPYPSAQWVQQCRQLLQREQRASAVLQGQAQPKDPAEQLQLAEFCRQYHRPWAAVRLYSLALAAQPQLAEDLSKEHRYLAACAAALATAGKGRDAVKMTDKEGGELRRQALHWLQVDLTLRKQHLHKRIPLTLALTEDQLPRWQTEPALARWREETDLAKLPQEEQQAWQQLWTEVAQLQKQARASRTETLLQGILTAQQKEQVHEVQMKAGRTYILEQRSKALDAFLRLEDASGKKLAEDDDSGGGQDARIIFTASQDGTYRVVASSFHQTGVGEYTLTIREYAGPR